MPLAVVTDSTAYLPADLLEGSGIEVVPVQVVIGGRPYDETADEASPARVADALRAWQPVTTSRPSPERFRHAFHDAAQNGAEAIVCATLSSRMSATHESAELAAKEVDVPVHLVDSRTVGMGLGFAVLAGARRASEGASAEDVAILIDRRARASTSLFYVDTLEYLRRGGRIGAARAAFGQALQVKPILQILDGEVMPLERVRTTSKAMARLTELSLAATLGRSVEIAIQHLDAADRAHELADTLRGYLTSTRVIECPLGAVVGAHTGPGIVAVVVSPLI
ncbi:MAG: DegV family protein [Actinomycetota bacterium]